MKAIAGRGKGTAGAGVSAGAAKREEALFARVVEIVEAARGHAARSVNTAMVQAYWFIGREIIQVEQHGARRAEYGDEVIERLAERLAERLGQGFGARTLRRIRQFYLVYAGGTAIPRKLGGARWLLAPSPNIRTAPLSKSRAPNIWTAPLSKSPPHLPPAFPSQLGWTHYLVLLRIADPMARAFYEIEAAREGWSSRELERQVASLLARTTCRRAAGSVLVASLRSTASQDDGDFSMADGRCSAARRACSVRAARCSPTSSCPYA